MAPSAPPLDPLLLAQFKDPVSHMCLAGAVVAPWPLIEEVAG